MSNHGSEPMNKMDDDFRQQMEIETQRLQLGATGRHPTQKMHDTDQGEIKLCIGSDDKTGKVMFNFGTPVTWMAFEPEQAVSIAQALIQHARKVSKTPITIRLN